MYERVQAGLGWDELSWTDWFLYRGICGQRGSLVGDRTHEVCFQETPEDQAIADAAHCIRYRNMLDSPKACGENGHIFCCPEGYPRPYMREIPPEASVYEAERERWLAQEPEDSTLPQEPVDSEGADQPPSVPRHTFWTKLSHPGAMAALAVLGAGGLFFLMRRR